MKRIIILFLVFVSLCFSASREDLEDLFKLEDSIIENNCEAKCREVKDGFKTKIIDFDAKTGMTYCEVYEEFSLNEKLNISANSLDKDCKQEHVIDLTDSDLSSKTSLTDTTTKTFDPDKYDEKRVTLSKFMGGLITLDSDIVDIAGTGNTGKFTLKNIDAIYSVSSKETTDGQSI